MKPSKDRVAPPTSGVSWPNLMLGRLSDQGERIAAQAQFRDLHVELNGLRGLSVGRLDVGIHVLARREGIRKRFGGENTPVRLESRCALSCERT